MAALADGLDEGWRRWRLERNRRGLKVGLLIMATLYPAFGLVDWLVASPPLLYQLWATRAVVAVATVAVWASLHTAFYARHGDAIASAYVVLGATTIMQPMLRARRNEQHPFS